MTFSTSTGLALASITEQLEFDFGLTAPALQSNRRTTTPDYPDVNGNTLRKGEADELSEVVR